MPHSQLETPLEQTACAASGGREELENAELLFGSGLLDEARNSALAAMEEFPLPASLMLGRIALRSQNFVEADYYFRRALECENAATTRLFLVAALTGARRPQEALSELGVAIRELPETARMMFQVGGLYEALEQFEDAEAFYERSLKKQPAPRVQHRLGTVLLMQNRVADSIAVFESLCRAEPGNIDYRIDLGTAYARSGNFENALSCVLEAIRARPEDVMALNNAGYALQCLNRSQEALQFYDRAVVVDPDYAPARFGRAVALLKNGAFATGWAEYDWRWLHGQSMRTDLKAPFWHGEDLTGKTILLHSEQGFGDTLQFIRLAQDVARLGARVLAHVPPALVRLMKNVEGLAGVYAAWDGSVPIDYHCPLLSVPARIGLIPANLPAAPYLSVCPEMQKETGEKLRHTVAGKGDKPDLIVGLVWAGDPRPHDKAAAHTDGRRSMTLADFALLARVEGVRFVSFQFGVAREQISTAPFPITDAMDGVTDFLDTAALLSGIDLLISVDTSIVHLAGGLGVPVWMLSRADGCWRWGENVSTTPWYPQTRIIRQEKAHDWAPVIAEAAGLLGQVVEIYRKTLAGAA